MCNTFFNNIENFTITVDDMKDRLPRQKVIQAIILYETQDYAIFRTEGGEELNIEKITLTDDKSVNLPVLLGRKLKAIQRRVGHAIIRTHKPDYNCFFETTEGGVKGLCGECPECILRGAVVQMQNKRYNIQSRVFYSAYFSVCEDRDVTRIITLNAVDDKWKVTGAALTAQTHIAPQVYIPAIISFYSVTKNELIYGLKTIKRGVRVGARTSVEGIVKPHAVALVGSFFEKFTPLELTIHVIKEERPPYTLHRVIESIKNYIEKNKSKETTVIYEDFLEKAEEVEDKDLIDELYNNEVEKFKEVLKSLLEGKKARESENK